MVPGSATPFAPIIPFIMSRATAHDEDLNQTMAMTTATKVSTQPIGRIQRS